MPNPAPAGSSGIRSVSRTRPVIEPIDPSARPELEAEAARVQRGRAFPPTRPRAVPQVHARPLRKAPEASMTPASPHDATDIISLEQPVERARRRVAVGWWIALAGAAAFFVSAALLAN